MNTIPNYNQISKFAAFTGSFKGPDTFKGLDEKPDIDVI
jgi:hypothetical protein